MSRQSPLFFFGERLTSYKPSSNTDANVPSCFDNSGSCRAMCVADSALVYSASALFGMSSELLLTRFPRCASEHALKACCRWPWDDSLFISGRR